MNFPLLIFFALFFLPSLLVALDFVYFLAKGKPLYGRMFRGFLEVTLLVFFPILSLSQDPGVNDCCHETTAFSLAHRPILYILIVACVVAYFYLAFRTAPQSPLGETLANILLLLGVALNVAIAIQLDLWALLIANGPIILLFLQQLARSHALFVQEWPDVAQDSLRPHERLAWRLLTLPALLKFPILLVLCLPLLVALAAFLMLAGQKPDALIRVFTDTYRHGFSQLDHECLSVDCSTSGHFLCTVGAQGHRAVVRPVRYGERHGHRIVCTRQLLVANAFEELMQERWPRTHAFVRRHYNRVGRAVHRHYGIFRIRWVADAVYLLMKPLEWSFLLTLYALDAKPENRIAMQYLSPEHRRQIKGEAATRFTS